MSEIQYVIGEWCWSDGKWFKVFRAPADDFEGLFKQIFIDRGKYSKAAWFKKEEIMRSPNGELCVRPS